MSEDLLETLVGAAPQRSPSGNIDWITVLDHCFMDPETRGLLAAIPSAERRALLAEAGRAVWRRDLGNFAAEIAYNTHFLETSGQLPAEPERWEGHAACLFASLGDMLDFVDRPTAEAHLAETEVQVFGRENLDAVPEGRGVILLSVFQSFIGYALPVLESLEHVALIRKPEAGEGPDFIPSQLLDWQDIVELVPADTGGGIRLFQLLRRGGAVGLYNDFLYGDARAARGLLFGRPVPISRTLLRLIRSTRAVVVPIAVARTFPLEGNRVEVHLFKPLSMSLTGGSEAALAIQISIATEWLIRRFPAQWRLWNTLRLRWEAGAELP